MAKRKMIWSKRSSIRLFEILEFYTNRNKTLRYSAKLYKRFVKELSLLDKHPEIGISTDFEDIRGLIIDDFIIFYEISPENIIVHTIWDCRQDPNNLKIR
ncbi:MAG: type II toxin-antitoxin system RelE/ParE family toxin [Bacteroidales bacterium]|nr:type II toxin-antitoxin system RelE/ParE family toxin [Bacteroidales bacterium]